MATNEPPAGDCGRLSANVFVDGLQNTKNGIVTSIMLAWVPRTWRWTNPQAELRSYAEHHSGANGNLMLAARILYFCKYPLQDLPSIYIIVT